jgi:galactokinase
MNIPELIATFKAQFGKQPTLLLHAPGRVNLLGEHVDYNDGPVLPAAIDRAVYLAANPNKSGVVQLYAPDIGEEISFSLERLDQKKDLSGNPLPGWALYPAGVAWALQNAGMEIQGMQAVYSSDVPIGAGLSSSAAVEMVFAVAWQTLGRWAAERMTLAQLCQQAENEYVGVACGLMDQFASAHGVADHALFFDTRSLDWEPVPLPQDTVLVVADSGVRHSLTSSAYNERRAECGQAVDILRLDLPHIQSLRDVSPAEFDQFRHNLPLTVRLRAEHVINEIERVHSAATALRKGDKETFGALMFAGHTSLRDLYDVSTPELDSLVEITRELTGCIGARLTGAGFGGCTINLVEGANSEDFIQGLQDGYRRNTGRETKVYLCKASQGAGVINFSG